MELPILYKPAQVAGLLQCSQRHVYTLIERGDLPHVRLGTLIRVPADALAAWVNRETVTNGPRD